MNGHFTSVSIGFVLDGLTAAAGMVATSKPILLVIEIGSPTHDQSSM
jgi:hypothetical protein